ncbi:thiamine-phosphate kinase [Salinithrix halophila]|uniref:Thiamine-monophosphate kinase n=1 Tax=Salinithrix halophila TaxID=1485204 RepID=A0ABV8JAE9_9BACL
MRDEFQLIRELLRHRPRPGNEVEVDVGDDAAVICPRSGMSLVVTCDTMMETVHFLPCTMAASDIGWKGMAANISDIAAMGGNPIGAVISLAAPEEWSDGQLAEVYRGLGEAAQRFGVSILGGDTVRSPKHLVLTITLLGEVEKGKALLRSSARPGDIVFVTGDLGSSAAGLHLLQREDAEEWQGCFSSLVQAHQRPIPRVDAGRLLLASGLVPACDDISDGLAQEASEIAEASGVRLVLEGERIPLAPDMRAYAWECGIDPLNWALSGGEDFQLLGTGSRDTWEALRERATACGIDLIPVGWVEAGTPGVDYVENGKRKPLTQKGYNHFAANG